MMKIRLATPADATALLAVYTPYVTDTAITFEYEIPTAAEFAARIAETLEGHPYLVAENQQGKILGYAYAHAYKAREAYDWTVEVSVYVAQDAQGSGVGKELYQQLETELAKQNVVNLAACITGGNQKSLQFHEKLGYRSAGLFKHFGYKFDCWHDVVWLQKTIKEPGELAPFIPYSQLGDRQL